MHIRKQTICFTLLLLGWVFTISAQTDTLFRASPSFDSNSHFVSSSVFHWYGVNGGQLSGPWLPVEGRENWTGQVPWWKTQIKQIMAANIEILNVHLMNQTEDVRENLFRALYELRSEGYDVPKVAPFFDAPITLYNQPMLDLATVAGKDFLADQYVRFFHQYFGQNPDPFAQDYLAKVNDRPMLDTWHVFLNMINVPSLSRNDLESRLSSALASQYPVFNNGIYMVTTALNNPVFSFADERVPQFEINQYIYPYTHNGITSVQLKGGYWDQNIRNPGDFLPRNGGDPYRNAWTQIDSTVDHIYIESWNEYDEGTGIYATNTSGPNILAGSGNTNTDTWSTSNDPYEYIRTTYEGASNFNDHPALGAIVLRHNFPTKMTPTETAEIILRLRNTGNQKWSAAEGFEYRQLASDPIQFMQSPASIDDNQNDIPTFDGIFRGRPLNFAVDIQAPDSIGSFQTNWQIFQNGVPFGEILTIDIQVAGFPSPIEPELALSFSLDQNVPNPFSKQTLIKLEVKEYVHSLDLKIYSQLGEEIAILAQGSHIAGQYRYEWDASNLPAGIYYYRVLADGQRLTKKMVLIKD